MRPEKSLAEALGPSTRERIEQLFQLLEAAAGRWRLELEAEDGHLKRVFRHEALSANELERFDATTI